MAYMTSTGWRPADTLAARLLLVRQQLGLSQRDAAAACGITFGEWQGLEMPNRRPRAIDEKVLKISRELGVDRDWLMWGGPLHDEGETYPEAATTPPGRVMRRGSSSRSITRRYLPDWATSGATVVVISDQARGSARTTRKAS